MDKKPALLFEVLIGLFLTGIIVVFLFRSLSQMTRETASLKTLHQRLDERQKFHARLQDLFLSISSGEEHTLETRVSSKESIPLLAFIYDYGIDPDPNFSGLCQGKLFLDPEKRLCLVTSPLGEEKIWRKEVLLSSVSQHRWLFPSCSYDSKTGKGKVVWKPDWEEKLLPSAIRLEIVSAEEETEYGFFLPSQGDRILFKEGS